MPVKMKQLCIYFSNKEMYSYFKKAPAEVICEIFTIEIIVTGDSLGNLEITSLCSENSYYNQSST